MSGRRSEIARRASRAYPCPICSRTSSCSVATSGLLFCIGANRSGDGWRHLYTLDNGFSVFTKDDGETRSPRPVHRARQVREHEQGVDPNPLLQQYLCKKQDRVFLADQLGIHGSGIDLLGAGRVPAEANRDGYWLLPERDQFGVLVGLHVRFDSGEKRHVKGTRRGLIYAVKPRNDPPVGNAVLIVEGYSDVATAESIGLWAVGRPSNTGGAEMLAPLLQHAAQRRGTTILLLGENDQKLDGTWPGRQGAESVANKLAAALGVEVRISYPPAEFKDLRVWLRSLLRSPSESSEQERHALGQRVLEELLTRAERVPAGSGTLPPLCEPVEQDSLQVAEVVKAGSSSRPCPKHQTPFLRHKGDPTQHRVVQAWCKAWSCLVCSYRKRSMWMSHLLGLFQGRETLFVSRLSASQFGRAKRFLQRKHGNYAAICVEGGSLVMITDQPTSSDGEQLQKPHEAADRAAQALLELDATAKRPVSTSQGWAMSREEGPREYRRVGQGRQGAFATIVGRLRRKGLNPQVSGDWRTGKRADWQMPEDIPDEEMEHLLDQLRAPRHETETPDPLDDAIDVRIDITEEEDGT